MRYIFVFLIYCSSFVFSQDVNRIFQQANDAYNKGLYDEAITLYNQIILDGQHDSSIYFNLGNSHYKLNNVAESIFYFEKAKKFSSKDKILN